jgi:hypothetical protein
LLQIKTKHRSRLSGEGGLQYALSSTSLRVKKLQAVKKQNLPMRGFFNFYIVMLSVFNKKIVENSEYLMHLSVIFYRCVSSYGIFYSVFLHCVMRLTMKMGHGGTEVENCWCRYCIMK